MNIGAVFLQLLADGSKLGPQVESEAQKAGDAGSKTLGQHLAQGLKTEGLKIFGAVASAAFGLATKGALELEDAQARFRAETGATVEEAERAGKIINKVAGDEQMALEDVTDIAIRVKRDLGAVGDQADTLTAKIAKFARVTKQDGAGAVESLDDIADNWGLTLEDLDGLMDRLVVSQHRWGGDLVANQKTLAKLGPAMRAANFQIEDGIALLGLFGSKGLDSERAAAAFSKALTKVESPAELQRLIDDISATQDPFLRAQKAAELFGTKAGAQLANALGGANLDDYKVSVEEAAGAVEDAGEIIDNTITGRIRKAFSQAGATLRQFGADLGPAATGLAGLATLFGSLGGGKLLRGLANITLKPLAGLGVRIGTFVATELAGSAVVNSLGSNLASAFNRVPGVSTVKSAMAKVGQFMGTTAGKAAGIAFGLAFVIWAINEIANKKGELDAAVAGLWKDIDAQIAKGTDAQLTQTRDALKTNIDQMAKDINENPIGGVFALDALKAQVAQFNAVQTELNRRAALAAAVTESQLRAAQPGAASAARDLVDQLPTTFEKSQGMLRAAAEQWIRLPIGQKLQRLGPDGVRAGAETSLGVAQGIRDKRSGIKAAMEQLRESIKHALKPTDEIGKNVGRLLGKSIRTGLKNSDAEVRAQADGTRALIEARLIELIKAGGKVGKDTLEELRKKMHDKDPDVREQARRTKSVIDEALKNQPATTPGEKITNDLSSDIRSGTGLVGRAAYDLGRTIARNLLAGVQGGAPTTSTSTGGGGGGGARRKAHGGPVEAGVAYIVGDRLGLTSAELFVPSEPGVIVPRVELAGSGAAGGGGDTFNLFLPDARHTDPWAVLDRMPRYAKQAKAAASDTGWKAA